MSKIDDTRECSLTRGFLYWRWCTSRNSRSKVYFPPSPQTARTFASPEYKRWWHQVHGEYLDNHMTDLINPEPIPAQQKEVVDVEEVSSRGKRKISPDHTIPVSEYVATLAGPSKRKSTSQHSKESRSGQDVNWKHVQQASKSPRLAEDPGSSLRKKIIEEVFGLEDEGHYSDEGESSFSVTASVAPVGGSTLKPIKSIEPTKPSKPPTGVVSIFKGDTFVKDHQRFYVSLLWNDFLDKIINTPIEQLSSVKDGVSYVMKEIKKHEQVDFSILEKSLAALFRQADEYDAVRSRSTEGIAKEILVVQLTEAKKALRTCLKDEKEESKQLEAIQAQLTQVEKELSDLSKKKEAFSEELQQHQHSLAGTKGKIRAAKEKILTLDNTPVLEEAVVEEVVRSQSKLEASLAELKNLNPFP